MINLMTRRWSPLAALFCSVLLVATTSFAQEDDGGEDWHDTPADEPGESDVEPDPEPEERALTPKDAPEAYDNRDPRALTDFKPTLDPHGTWVDHPRYGTVWVPNRAEVGEDFAPYVTNGRWALSPEGDWIWVSNYKWGWATFHYGRWVWVSNHGWAWVPGREYAPAWVVWRVPTGSYSYVGWAPMPPDYAWHGGVAVSVTYRTYYPYVFCPSPYVFSYRVHHHVIHDRRHVYRVARHTRVYRAPPRYHRRAPPTRVARVPTRAVPKRRVAADPRALRMASARQPRAAGPRPATSGSRAIRPRSGSVTRARPIARRPSKAAPRLRSSKTLRGSSVRGAPPRTGQVRPARASGSTRPAAPAPSKTRSSRVRKPSANQSEKESSSKKYRPAARSVAPSRAAPPRRMTSPKSSPKRRMSTPPKVRARPGGSVRKSSPGRYSAPRKAPKRRTK